MPAAPQDAKLLKLPQKIVRPTPERKACRLIADNYPNHKHPAVQESLSKHPRILIPSTTTSASWLNMEETLFGNIITGGLRQGVFTSVAESEAAIHEYVDHHNANPKSFIRTKSTHDILQEVIRANSRLSARHNETMH